MRKSCKHGLFQASLDSGGQQWTISGGDGGIRTLDTLNTYDDLANRCLQPLGHVSIASGFCRDLIDDASASDCSPPNPSERWQNVITD